jgi:hypothetical protein
MSKGNEMRLRAWRQFRESIVDLSRIEKIEAINKFWMMYPFMSRTVDPDDSSNWLKPWDMVYYDEICEYSRAIMMHQTALLMLDDMDDSFLVYAIDISKQNDYMLAVIDGFAMNYNMSLVQYTDIKHELNIQNTFKSNKKGVYTKL